MGSLDVLILFDASRGGTRSSSQLMDTPGRMTSFKECPISRERPRVEFPIATGQGVTDVTTNEMVTVSRYVAPLTVPPSNRPSVALPDTVPPR